MGTNTLLLLQAAASAWLCVSVPVFAQEAYYWTYAQHPALSYFDHPPMVAWLIWLGTTVFGDGAVGLRLGTWACGVATTWFGLQLLRGFGVDRAGQAAWIVLGLATPALVMTRFFANPDPPLVCCWTATMVALWRARNGGLGWWIAAGIAAGAALLSKYTGAFLAVGGVALLLLDAPMRRQLRKPGPWVGVAIAAVVFLPVVLWNVDNHFESFRFQTAHRFEVGGGFDLRHPVNFVLGQFGMLHPAIALVLPFATWWLLRRACRDPGRSGSSRSACRCRSTCCSTRSGCR